MSLVPLYWIFTSYGNVYPGPGTAWYGSPIASRFRGSSIVGMAATADGRGYWLVNTSGRVFASGDAVPNATVRRRHPISGIVAGARGGYWLYTPYGNVYPSPGGAWYGSPRASGFRGSSITGMAATPDGGGYWLVSAAGRVFAYGDAAPLSLGRRARHIKGIVAAAGGGWWLFTTRGSVSSTAGTPWYGSPRADGFRGSSIVAMAPTADGQGYWLIGSAGQVFAFGDAAWPFPQRFRHPVSGIAGG
jgi:hypothetical protein